MAVIPSPLGCPGLDRPAPSHGVLGSPTSPYGRDPASSSAAPAAREESARPPEPSPPPHPQVPRRTHRGSGRSGTERLRAVSGVLTARRATARTAMAPGSLVRTLRGARPSLQVPGGGGARGAATATFNCAASANEKARAAFERQRPRARRLRSRRAARQRGRGALAEGGWEGRASVAGVAPRGGRAGARTSQGRGRAGDRRLLEAAGGGLLIT